MPVHHDKAAVAYTQEIADYLERMIKDPPKGVRVECTVWMVVNATAHVLSARVLPDKGPEALKNAVDTFEHHFRVQGLLPPRIN